jgi:hypothetical protein
MIENKEIPSEYVSIRAVWLRAIDRCAEAISFRFKTDVSDIHNQEVGVQTIIETVVSLYSLLVDHGEATVLSDVERWYDQHKDDFRNAKTGYDRMQIYRKWFVFMVQTLNKYGMLFESQPKGYSNTDIKSV